MGRRLKKLLTVMYAAAVLLALSMIATGLPSGDSCHRLTRSPATGDSWYTSSDAPDVIVRVTGAFLAPPTDVASLAPAPNLPETRAAKDSPWKNRAPPRGEAS